MGNTGGLAEGFETDEALMFKNTSSLTELCPKRNIVSNKYNNIENHNLRLDFADLCPSDPS